MSFLSCEMNKRRPEPMERQTRTRQFRVGQVTEVIVLREFELQDLPERRERLLELCSLRGGRRSARERTELETSDESSEPAKC